MTRFNALMKSRVERVKEDVKILTPFRKPKPPLMPYVCLQEFHGLMIFLELAFFSHPKLTLPFTTICSRFFDSLFCNRCPLIQNKLKEFISNNLQNDVPQSQFQVSPLFMFDQAHQLSMIVLSGNPKFPSIGIFLILIKFIGVFRVSFNSTLYWNFSIGFICNNWELALCGL